MSADTPLRIDVAAEQSPQNRPSAFIRLLGRVERSTGLDPVVRAAEPLASRMVANERLRRVLHGNATGIPLHIIYTDVPLGAWWMAQFLDLFPDDGMRRAAARLVGLGVVAAVPTALTGWAEWARADRGARRVGIVHATANARSVATMGSGCGGCTAHDHPPDSPDSFHASLIPSPFRWCTGDGRRRLVRSNRAEPVGQHV